MSDDRWELVEAGLWVHVEVHGNEEAQVVAGVTAVGEVEGRDRRSMGKETVTTHRIPDEGPGLTRH